MLDLATAINHLPLFEPWCGLANKYIAEGSEYLKTDAVVYLSLTESPCYKACKAKVNAIVRQ